MGSFYTQRFLKLVYLHLPTDCFMKIFLQSTGLCLLEYRLKSDENRYQYTQHKKVSTAVVNNDLIGDYEQTPYC